MSIKIFGKRFFKSTLEKRRDLLKEMYSDIADKYEEYYSEWGEDLYTQTLQEKQQLILAELDKITEKIGWI